MTFVARALGALLAVLCLWGAAGAQAAPLRYTVAATFLDGGSAAGSFTFDADSSTYSNVDIIISNSATPSLDGSYTFVCPAADCFGYPAASASELTVLRNSLPPPPPTTDLTGQPVIQFVYQSDLTDAGQGITAVADYGTCSVLTCIGINNGLDGIRHSNSATIAGPVVPTLTQWSVAMFALLLSGFAVLRLRRTVSA
jgi:hypothetical protein